MSKTTIVIPNYNGIKYIEDCLDSLLNAGNYPIVVVDNGSRDGSADIISKKYPQVQLIRLDENTGFCHAVNVGLGKVETEYVFLLNNDTVVDAECIKTLEKRMDAEKKAFSVQARILNLFNRDLIDDYGDLYSALGWAYARGKDKGAENYKASEECFACCGAAVLYKMSVFDEIGMFDEKHFAYLEDIDLGYRARIYGYRNIVEPRAVIYHAGSATSGSRHNRFKVDLSARNNVYLIYKNMPLVQWCINLPLLILGFLIKIMFFFLKGMGFTYIKGLFKGIGLSLSDIKKGRPSKVCFKMANLKNYLIIQCELWANIFKRL